MKTMLGLLLLVTVTAGGACTGSSTPPRPPKVPLTAVWAGGPDGGAWVDCRVDTTRDVNPCTVYNEVQGDVWMKGSFVLRDVGRAASKEELVFGAFDGVSILLADGKVLDRIDSR